MNSILKKGVLGIVYQRRYSYVQKFAFALIAWAFIELLVGPVLSIIKEEHIFWVISWIDALISGAVGLGLAYWSRKKQSTPSP